jgi:aryl-alcohol dehydrogenase-like predicted oxidoreductase
MNHRTFGKTGLSVTSLGFGAGPIGYLGTDQKQVETIVNTLLDAGVDIIDTAAAYHGSEEALGKAVAYRRKEFILVSKCGQQFDDLPGQAWSAAAVTATVDRSLRRLKTDHLDVMLLHSCNLEVLQRGEALGALIRARDAGKILFAGYSGDNEEAVYAAGLAEISVVETSINICDQANLATVLPAAREQNIGIIAKRPIANTAWRPAQELQGIYQDYAKPYRERFAAMGITAQDVGFSSEADWPEIALRFTLSHSGVHVAIIGTTNPLNAKRNLEAAAKGPLPKIALEKLVSAFKRAEASGSQKWPGLT